jgi:protein-S-isoprenylcysteine O-methyltransferase Ste14
MGGFMTGKILYALLFVAVIPAALVIWAGYQMGLPRPIHSELWGIVTGTAGCAIWITGVMQLSLEGEGLPMNGYPPKRLVSGGIYRIIPHPVYFGAVLISAGISIAFGSAAGLWLVTPLLAFGCAALVFGHERPDLARRFPDINSVSPLIGIPPATDDPASFARRLGCVIAVLSLWVVSYMGIKAMGFPHDAIETRMIWEQSIPVIPWAMPVYESLYLLVPMSFLLPASSRFLRKLFIQSIVLTVVASLIYLCLPLSAGFRWASGDGFFSAWLRAEQILSYPAVASLPSFHVIWALIWAGTMYARRKSSLWWIWAVLVCVSCLVTGMHSLADIVAGVIVWYIFRDPLRVWAWMLRYAETLANSWRSIRIGPVRIINHSVWPGIAGMSGFAGVIALAGTKAVPWMAAVGLCGLVGSALWAQLIEGSAKLARPFGYYGFLLGASIGIVLVSFLGGPWELILGSLAVVAPWVQAIGRVRCLVQGCCHGAPSERGIRVTNPHSRVTSLAELSGVTIHPTQVYSILMNIPIGALLLRLWVLGADIFLIAGLYLILSGMARFVEEGYRGEPHTERILGLPLYQWTAVLQLASGFVLSALRGYSAPAMKISDPAFFIWAAGFGILCACAMGIDFPGSGRRFSRLSG